MLFDALSPYQLQLK